MKIAVLGTGRVGSVLGTRWGQLNHSIVYGSRNPDSPQVQELVKAAGSATRAATYPAAIASADVIVLALPWNRVREVLETADDLSGKILIDCINPLSADFKDLDLGHTTSASERIASWFPLAHVVKAFNTVSTAAMRNPLFDGERASMFYCGDDPEAKEILNQLASQLGFEPHDAGALLIARYLEPLAMLYIKLSMLEGWGSNYAFKLMRR